MCVRCVMLNLRLERPLFNILLIHMPGKTTSSIGISVSFAMWRYMVMKLERIICAEHLSISVMAVR